MPMHSAVNTMLEKYHCHSEQDYINALKEIFQEIALLGLWRAKFMEVDTHPPGKFQTEVKNLLLPIPFSVKTLTKSDLFAGKLHAILCRPWQKRVKGRDWYDLVWYIARDIPVNLEHLRARLIQSAAWQRKNKLSREDLLKLLIYKINHTDFKNAKADIIPFIRDKRAVELWSKDFFLELIQNMKNT